MTLTTAICLGFGAALGLAGLFVLRTARGDTDNRTRVPSRPTRLLLGVVLLVAGYHAAAWSGPAEWFPIKIPVRLWPLAAGLAVVGVAGSVWMDRREAERTSR